MTTPDNIREADRAEEWLERLKSVVGHYHRFDGNTNTVKCSVKTIEAAISSYEERGKHLQLACEALFPEPRPKEIDGMMFNVTSDASINLQGVLADIQRDPNSGVNQRTINRVLEQLETARAHLNKETPNG